MGLIKMNKQIFLLILIFTIIYLPITSAETYYADITIDVDQYGFITIDGVTNQPNLLEKNTENYTSKKQSFWKDWQDGEINRLVREGYVEKASKLI